MSKKDLFCIFSQARSNKPTISKNLSIKSNQFLNTHRQDKTHFHLPSPPLNNRQTLEAHPAPPSTAHLLPPPPAHPSDWFTSAATVQAHYTHTS